MPAGFQGQPLGLRPWLEWELGVASKPKGTRGPLLPFSPDFQTPTIPWAPSHRPAGRPAPGPALPSLSLRRSSGLHCSDISALTGPCQDITDLLPVWVAVGFSGPVPGGVRREEAGGGAGGSGGVCP